MGIIKLLDKSVANMIAAGEVVERPASVVKELLENSIDAGATHITTEIKNGGIKFIRVADNGSGMSAEDVRTSLVRHATSKLSTAQELDGIMTLGFRGEALASIAAVSNMEIYTKTETEELGAHLVSAAGGEVTVSEAGCPKGTTVLVRELFCTAPARMKFLKKDFTEGGYIADIVNRLALGMPQISFKFISNEKEQLFTSGDGSLKNAVMSVYGRDVAAAMVSCDYTENGVRAHGLCGKSETARANRGMQSFFINGRYIKSALLTRAVEEAYKNELMTGKFPACVINLEINPRTVDINVHPTKLEAKFANENDVYHAVYWAVKNALYSKNTIPTVKAPQTEERAELAYKEQLRLLRDLPRTAVMQQRQTAQPEAEIKPPKAETGAKSVSMRESGAIPPPKPQPKSTAEIPAVPEMPEKPKTPEKPEPAEKNAAVKRAETAAPQAAEQVADTAFCELPYKICGQIFSTYIIVERGGEMLLVDQHAAHERLRYEELLRSYEQRKIASQTLLIPTSFNLTPLEMSEFTEFSQQLSDLGFDAEEFGENSLIVRAVPLELSESDIKNLIIEILDGFSKGRRSDMPELVRRALYQISCKGAVKANMKLSETEMNALLKDVFALEGISTCPHGRPITVSFTKHFIEKQFKRII